jgi:predicted XRE-type DNA-binding protein
MAAAKDLLSPADFRLRLRKTFLSNPNLTLAQVARALGVTRQRVALIVGRLDRPTGKPAIKREQARAKMAELKKRVAGGESAEQAAKALGISLAAATAQGFRARGIKPAHGGGRKDCFCWRCRRAAGVALQRGPRMGAAQKAAVLDLLAWRDPDDGSRMTQAEIGRLTGVGQAAVSRIARSAQ